MTAYTRFTALRALAITAIVLALPYGCGGVSGSSGNSNTNWLHACDKDADCGSALGCFCGVCTLGCGTSSDCASLGSSATCASAAAASEVCSGFSAPSASLCLPSCSGGTGCDGGHRCVLGVCSPEVVPDASATGGHPGTPDASLGSHDAGAGGGIGTGGTDGGCGGNETNCSGTCTDLSHDPGHCGACDHACGPTEQCSGGRCRAYCSPLFTFCRRSEGQQRVIVESCEDTSANPNSCGACGHACKADERCSHGACVPYCTIPGHTYCGGCLLDIDLSRDPENCGTCGHQCDTFGPFQSHVCTNGTCVCKGGLTECGGGGVGPGAGPNCVNKRTDPLNCGVCGKVCPGTQVCSDGACAATCAGSLANCNGACADLSTDQQNCGACGNTCIPLDMVCTDAGGGVPQHSCQSEPCPLGMVKCPGPGTPFGRCVDTATDLANCGACGTPCNGTCVGGTCTCPDGFTNCSGACADLSNDPYNCLRCGNTCGSGKMCGASGCTTQVTSACAAGLVGCTDVPDGGRYDVACYCGSCGNTCSPTQSCVGGVCQ